jgi:predicted MFS family arabinose efflux permease
VIIISLWVPLAMVALLTGGRMGQWLAGLTVTPVNPVPGSPVLLAPAAVLLVLSFGIACGVGGAVLGRFRERSARRHAALAVAGSVAILMVFVALGRALPSVAFAAAVSALLLVIGIPSAIMGHRWGSLRRTLTSDGVVPKTDP